MDLTHEQMDTWARGLTAGIHYIRLSEGESMPANDYGDRRITGPATVSFVAYRQGGWTAQPLHTWTPEGIAR